MNHHITPSLFLLVLVVGALMSACSGSEPTSRADQERAFRAEMGLSPGSEIKTIRVKSISIGDTWAQWMCFSLDEPTLSNIVSKGWSYAPNWSEKTAGGGLWSQTLREENPNAPTWWKLPPDMPTMVYYQTNHPADFAGFRVLWVDSSNRLVFTESDAWH
jgi:hypothetical protein